VKKVAQRILVIDDDVATREGFRGALTRSGFDARTAGTARDGLVMAADGWPDLVILDLGLPDMHGLDLLRRFRDAHLEAPCVVMTGFGSVAEAAHAFKLGARDFIEKPIADAELLRVVREIVDERSSTVDWRVVEALRIIEQRYPQADLSLRGVARELEVSAEHLCRLLKRQTGTGFGRRLHEARVQEAKRLLRETNLAVKEVAFRTGYSDADRLSHYFKRFCRVLPTAYRQTARGASSIVQGRNQ
jgi:YesN/AraC family two-component response regulator